MKKDLHIGKTKFKKGKSVFAAGHRAAFFLKALFVFTILLNLLPFTSLAQPSNYYLNRFGLGGVNMTINSPVNDIITNTSQASSASTNYLVSWDYDYNRWYNTATPFNSVFTLTFVANDNAKNGVLSTATTNGKYYTFQIRGLSYSNRQAVLMETDNTPQSFHSTASTAVSTPSAVYPGQGAAITVTLAGSKSSQEKVFVRYTTDNWATSKVAEATGSGTTWTTAAATIPSADNFPGAVVKYYAYTTTVSATSTSDHDLISLKLGNNGGSNYSYTVASSWVTANNGNWSTPSTWTAGVVPVDGQPITINHNVTLDQNATVSSLTINSGKTFTASDGTARTLTIAKSASGSSTTLSNSGTWANGTGGSTVVFTGAPSGGDAIHAVSGTIAFQNITVNKTGGSSNVGVSFGTGTTVSGTLEIGSGGFVASDYPGTSFWGSNGILKFNTGGGYNVNADPADKTWPGTTNIPPNIQISSGTVNLNVARTASGNLVIDGGTLALGAPLTIQGNWTRSSGTFTPNSQTVTLSGTTNTLITTASDAALYDLVVNKTSASVNLASNVNVTHNMTISSGTFNVSAGKALTVSGTLTNSVGNTALVVESGGSLITSSAVAATVKRNVPAATWTDKTTGWHFLSSPLAAQAIAPDFTPTVSGYDLYCWNEATADWVNFKDNSVEPKFTTVNGANFTPGRGYMVAYQLATTDKSFTGTLNSANQTVSVTNTPARGTYAGWNLVGNPYPSAITWNTSWTVNSGTLDGTAKIWNATNKSYTDLGSGSAVPAQNGVFVKVSATTTLNIPAANKLHSTQAFYKSAKSRILLLATETQYNTAQECVINANSEATEGFDHDFDSPFMAGYAPELYSVAGGEKLSTNILPAISNDRVIDLGFVKNQATDYTITLQEEIPFLTVFLSDKKTGTETNLTEARSYSFTAAEGDNPNRFALHFMGTTGISPVNASKGISAYVAGNTVHINQAVQQSGKVYLYNTAGQMLSMSQMQASPAQTLALPQLSPGVYILSIRTALGTQNQKVVIQ